MADRLAQITRSRGQAAPLAPAAGTISVPAASTGAVSTRGTEVAASPVGHNAVGEAADPARRAAAYRALRATGPAMALHADESSSMPALAGRRAPWPFAVKAAIVGVLVAGLATTGGVLYFRLLAPVQKDQVQVPGQDQVVTLTILQAEQQLEQEAKPDKKRARPKAQRPAAVRPRPTGRVSGPKRGLARRDVVDILAAAGGKRVSPRSRAAARADVDVDGILQAAVEKPEAEPAVDPELELSYEPPTKAVMDEDEQSEGALLDGVR